MRYQGRIIDWNDEKGFGFITPIGGGDRVFVHISAFGKDQHRPVGNEIVTYVLQKNSRKGHRAANVRYQSVHSARTRLRSERLPVRLFVLVIAAALVYVYFEEPSISLPGRSAWMSGGDATAQSAYRNRQSDIQAKGKGVVTRIRTDDLDGSRHQRFILRLETGQTVLISHNIDLAPRVGSLHTGDTVAFYGEYEWNAQGGVIHWTHRDPGGHHANGWLKHDGRTYQ